MKNKTRDEEQFFLKKVLEFIELKYKAVVLRSNMSVQEIQEMKEYFWESLAEMDGIEKNANRMQILDAAIVNENTEEIKRGLEAQRKSPYFARIDFIERMENHRDAKKLAVYIGIRGLQKDATKEMIIHDWRAPISGMFYDYELGSASFLAPMGMCSGRITEKRQYKIQNGKLEYMLESSVNVDDEILQKELSHNTDEKMKNIVATIQKEQNQIIRNEDAGVLLIQGAAGSGKTSIAMHRIAFMLYRFKNTIKSQDMLILSPNKVFSNYISNVLPELGEDNIGEISFESMARDIMGSRFQFQTFAEQVSWLLKENTSQQSNRIEFKASVSFYVDLMDYLSNLERDYFKAEDIVVENITISKEKLLEYMKNMPKLPLKEKINKLKKDVIQRMKMLCNHKGVDFSTKDASMIRNTITQMFPFKNANEIYENFYLKIRKTELLQKCGKNRWEYADVFPLIFTKIYWEKVEDYYHVKHLLIDEMQDYTPIQYAVIAKLFSCKMTILGDAYQAVNPYSSSTVGKIRAIFQKSQSVTLRKSYRSTIEIAEFAQKISKNPEIEPIERHGLPPDILKAEDNEEQIGLIKLRIKEFQKSTSSLMGIICKTEEMAKEMYQKLKECKEVHLLNFESEEFKDGVVITSCHMSKGLEFDKVFIPNVSKQEYHTKMDSKLLYVACTRAMHELNLSYVEEPSDFLSPFLQ